jgi:hypothetical protein
MSLNRYAKRRDANERDIIDTLKGFGLSVETLDTPCDGVAGFAGLDRLFEVKEARNKKNEPKPYTERQEEFWAEWKGYHSTPLVTIEDAREFALQLRQDARLLADMKARAA